MAKYKNVELKEKQLEDLVRRFPEDIEEGLRYVDHQKFTDRGPLDVLLVDSGNSLVICELKVVEDDNMLMQGLDYYDYMTRNVEGFARAYSDKGLKIDPTQEPRLFLIAPSFSITLINRCKWIELPIFLYSYQVIELESQPGDLIPIYKDITIPPKQVTIEVYSLEKRLKYITDNLVRKNVENLISEIKTWEKDKIVAEPTKYEISLKVNGKVFAYIAPRRKHYLIYTNDIDGIWKGFKIDNNEELLGVLQIVKINFDIKKSN